MRLSGPSTDSVFANSAQATCASTEVSTICTNIFLMYLEGRELAWRIDKGSERHTLCCTAVYLRGLGNGDR